MTSPLFYWSFLALCSIYILARGGAPERLGILVAIVASVLSTASVTRGMASRFSSVEAGILIIDLITLVAFLALVARADRYWPLWVAGMHTVSVATHAAILIDPTWCRGVRLRTGALVLSDSLGDGGRHDPPPPSPRVTVSTDPGQPPSSHRRLPRASLGRAADRRVRLVGAGTRRTSRNRRE